MKVLRLGCLNNAINTYAYMAGGRILDLFANREKALNCYDKAMQFDFHTIRLLKLKGEQLIKLNRYNDALNCYVKIILINSNDYRSYYNIAFLLYKTNKNEYAVNMLKKCVKINSNYYRAYILMAKIMYDKEDYENAVLFSEKAIKIQPDNSMAYEIRNNSLIDLGAVYEKHNSESYFEELGCDYNNEEECLINSLNASLFIFNKIYI
ncbi:hypothetical protein [Clostridium sp. JN-9]|uniref:tetratricopeptide repeat protein n=1 Tax=Clostridium sp. JN-9 TaxID=2507159 RepID=UPI000FFE2E24|nr:hypothetical protein [Clostridium sp. JN-9]QAT40743.1 hypothetical protein EQM05_11005 [Clostridium sp. JN-9]